MMQFMSFQFTSIKWIEYLLRCINLKRALFTKHSLKKLKILKLIIYPLNT